MNPIMDAASRLTISAQTEDYAAANCTSSDGQTNYRLAIVFVDEGAGPTLQPFCSCPWWRNRGLKGTSAEWCSHASALLLQWKGRENPHHSQEGVPSGAVVAQDGRTRAGWTITKERWTNA